MPSDSPHPPQPIQPYSSSSKQSDHNGFRYPAPTSRLGYFGNAVHDSPEPSEDALSDSTSSCAGDDDRSVATLDDCESCPQFGHPLQRMRRVKSANHGSLYDSDDEVNKLLRATELSSNYPSRSESTTSIASSVAYESIDYEGIINHMFEAKSDPKSPESIGDCSDHRNLESKSAAPKKYISHHLNNTPPLMVRQLPRSSSELLPLLELNHSELRQDPWNPAPHILRVVERKDHVYLCVQQLFDFNQPPLSTVAQYVDLLRQILEGLTFLHEHRIAGLNCASPSSYMVDLSCCSKSTPKPGISSEASLDRASYPVRYYFVDFSNAKEVPNADETGPRDEFLFEQDVNDCGDFIDTQLLSVPQLVPKFKALTKAMQGGDFTADGSRKLFEALCRSLDAGVFDSPAVSIVPTAPQKQSDSR